MSARRLAPLAAAALLLARTVAAEPVPGTVVSLDPPAGFARSTQFPGFQKREAGASILVTEVPRPVAELRAGLSPAGLAKQGMKLLGSEETRIADRPALLMHASQTAPGASFEKWMVVFGDAHRSVLLVATFPAGSAAALREPLRRALTSARWDPSRTVGRFDGLPYRVSETGDLKISARVTNTLVLTRGGMGTPVPASEPLVVVGASVSQVEIPDVGVFARDRVTKTVGIEKLANIEGTIATVDQLPAYEIVADAQDAKTGTPIRIYQLIIVDARRYFLVQGLVGMAQSERFLPQFRALGRSLKRSN